MANDPWAYSEVVKDHFLNPRNMLVGDEKSFEADGVGTVGSPACGDMMKVYIKVDTSTDKISDFKWKTFGCASAIGSTSMLSVMVTEGGGMKMDEALKITPQDIIDRLGGLPAHKIHCSVLGDKALREAAYDYFRRTQQESRLQDARGHMVCQCLDVTSQEIEDAVAEDAHTWEQLQARTKISTGCGRCEEEARAIFEKALSKVKAMGGH